MIMNNEILYQNLIWQILLRKSVYNMQGQQELLCQKGRHDLLMIFSYSLYIDGNILPSLYIDGGILPYL